VAGIVGIGIDLVSIERLRAVLARYGPRFVERVLTADERSYCQRHQDPAPQVASRFAAKEAVLKALGTGLARGIRWQDVEVRRDGQGPPRIHLSGRAAEEAATLGVDRIHLSISHDHGTAVAMVILERSG
jgi:holo-[acyl-carrier protein] synthase